MGDTITVVTQNANVTVIPSETVVTVAGCGGGSGGGGTGLTTSFIRVNGSSFDGTEGAVDRSYTAAYDILNNSVSMSGRWLDSATQYTIVGNVITIHSEMFNDDYIVFGVNS